MLGRISWTPSIYSTSSALFWVTMVHSSSGRMSLTSSAVTLLVCFLSISCLMFSETAEILEGFALCLAFVCYNGKYHRVTEGKWWISHVACIALMNKFSTEVRLYFPTEELITNLPRIKILTQKLPVWIWILALWAFGSDCLLWWSMGTTYFLDLACTVSELSGSFRRHT